MGPFSSCAVSRLQLRPQKITWPQKKKKIQVAEFIKFSFFLFFWTRFLCFTLLVPSLRLSTLVLISQKNRSRSSGLCRIDYGSIRFFSFFSFLVENYICWNYKCSKEEWGRGD